MFYSHRCSCAKASCITNRCACFKAGRKCNSRCHPKNSSCRNHDQDLQGFLVDDIHFSEEEDNSDDEDDEEDEEKDDHKKQKTK